MKKITAFLTFSLALAAHAENAWISDALQTSVSDKPDVNGKFLGSLNAGEPVELLDKSQDGRYVRVKSAKLDGWVWARNIQNTPSLHVQFASLQKNLQEVQAENARLKSISEAGTAEAASLREQLAAAKQRAQQNQDNLAALQQNLTQAESKNAELSSNSQNASAAVEELRMQLRQAQDNAQKARAELVALQRASANVVQIDARNRELQAQVVSLEQENLNLRHTNARLEETKSQKHMTIGGLLVIAGVFLSWLFGWIRRSSRRQSFDSL